MTMRIVLISQNVYPGILIFRKDFIKYLVADGHDVYCFCLDYNRESKSIVEGLGAIPVDYRLDKSGFNIFRDLYDIFILSKKIKSITPDVVFSFFVKPSIYGTLAAALAKVPRRIAMLEGLGYIYTPSERGFSIKKRFLQRIHGILATLGYCAADNILFLNKDDPKDLALNSLIKKNKIIVLGPIGLDLDRYPYTKVNKKKAVRFIFVARLLVEKGIFEYADAAKLVQKKYPDAEFVVLGGLDPDNPAALSSNQLQAMINTGCIIYPGHVKNVHEWIADSHIFVLPSYREGFPRSTQEAMAIGRAVITTDVPGCRETVIDGVNGFIVPPWSAKVLAEKMIYFIENPEEISRMGDASHNIAIGRYDCEKINPILASIITGNTH